MNPATGAAAGSVAGPAGTIVGAAIGTIGLVGSAALSAWEAYQALIDINSSTLQRVSDIVDGLNAGGNDSTTIPWPPKNPRKWTCICRADANERSPDLVCQFNKMFAFGWGVGPTMQSALRAAEKMAKDILQANSVHHVQCKCTGPKGERRNRS